MQRFRTLPDRLSRVVDGSVPPLVLGFVLTVVSVSHFLAELRALRVTLPPILAAVVTLSLSFGVVLVGVWLRRSSIEGPDRWVVGGGTLLGALGGMTLAWLTVFIRRLESRPVGEPLFPVLVVAALGALAGAGIGYLYVDLRTEAERAREVRDAMAFTNSLIRHDVRNGLQIMRAHGEVAAAAEDDRVQTSGAALLEQVDTLVDLVEEVQAVSNVLLEEADPDAVDVEELLTDCVETASESHPEATFELDVPDSLSVRGTAALVPVFTNLLNNAAQHTPEDVHVRVTAHRNGDTVVVTVADDGPGIPVRDRERVFERGVSTDGGDGMGLHIVETLLERSEGAVRVEESDRGGAAFVVELPYADPSEDDE